MSATVTLASQGHSSCLPEYAYSSSIFLQYPSVAALYLSRPKSFFPYIYIAMKLSALAIASGFAALALAAPAPPSYVVHEKREVQTGKWSRRRDIKLNRDAIIPMSFGLTQRNLENGYDFLMDVSHPESKNYGKHWSMEKVFRNISEKEIDADKVRSRILLLLLLRRLTSLSRGFWKVALKTRESTCLRAAIG